MFAVRTVDFPALGNKAEEKEKRAQEGLLDWERELLEMAAKAEAAFKAEESAKADLEKEAAASLEEPAFSGEELLARAEELVSAEREAFRAARKARKAAEKAALKEQKAAPFREARRLLLAAEAEKSAEEKAAAEAAKEAAKAAGAEKRKQRALAREEREKLRLLKEEALRLPKVRAAKPVLSSEEATALKAAAEARIALNRAVQQQVKVVKGLGKAKEAEPVKMGPKQGTIYDYWSECKNILAAEKASVKTKDFYLQYLVKYMKAKKVLVEAKKRLGSLSRIALDKEHSCSDSACSTCKVLVSKAREEKCVKNRKDMMSSCLLTLKTFCERRATYKSTLSSKRGERNLAIWLGLKRWDIGSDGIAMRDLARSQKKKANREASEYLVLGVTSKTEAQVGNMWAKLCMLEDDTENVYHPYDVPMPYTYNRKTCALTSSGDSGEVKISKRPKKVKKPKVTAKVAKKIALEEDINAAAFWRSHPKSERAALMATFDPKQQDRIRSLMLNNWKVVMPKAAEMRDQRRAKQWREKKVVLEDNKKTTRKEQFLEAVDHIKLIRLERRQELNQAFENIKIVRKKEWSDRMEARKKVLKERSEQYLRDKLARQETAIKRQEIWKENFLKNKELMEQRREEYLQRVARRKHRELQPKERTPVVYKGITMVPHVNIALPRADEFWNTDLQIPAEPFVAPVFKEQLPYKRAPIVVNNMKTTRLAKVGGEWHNHQCIKCKREYRHKHEFAGTHMQTAYQCSYNDCEWHFSKGSGIQKINKTRSHRLEGRRNNASTIVWDGSTTKCSICECNPSNCWCLSTEAAQVACKTEEPEIWHSGRPTPKEVELNKSFEDVGGYVRMKPEAGILYPWHAVRDKKNPLGDVVDPASLLRPFGYQSIVNIGDTLGPAYQVFPKKKLIHFNLGKFPQSMYVYTFCCDEELKSGTPIYACGELVSIVTCSIGNNYVIMAGDTTIALGPRTEGDIHHTCAGMVSSPKNERTEETPDSLVTYTFSDGLTRVEIGKSGLRDFLTNLYEPELVYKVKPGEVINGSLCFQSNYGNTSYTFETSNVFLALKVKPIFLGGINWDSKEAIDESLFLDGLHIAQKKEGGVQLNFVKDKKNLVNIHIANIKYIYPPTGDLTYHSPTFKQEIVRGAEVCFVGRENEQIVVTADHCTELSTPIHQRHTDLFSKVDLHPVGEMVRIGTAESPLVKLSDDFLFTYSKMPNHRTGNNHDWSLSVSTVRYLLSEKPLLSGTPLYNKAGDLCSIITTANGNKYSVINTEQFQTTIPVQKLTVNLVEKWISPYSTNNLIAEKVNIQFQNGTVTVEQSGGSVIEAFGKYDLSIKVNEVITTWLDEEIEFKMEQFSDTDYAYFGYLRGSLVIGQEQACIGRIRDDYRLQIPNIYTKIELDIVKNDKIAIGHHSYDLQPPYEVINYNYPDSRIYNREGTKGAFVVTLSREFITDKRFVIGTPIYSNGKLVSIITASTKGGWVVSQKMDHTIFAGKLTKFVVSDYSSHELSFPGNCEDPKEVKIIVKNDKELFIKINEENQLLETNLKIINPSIFNPTWERNMIVNGDIQATNDELEPSLIADYLMDPNEIIFGVEGAGNSVCIYGRAKGKIVLAPDHCMNDHSIRTTRYPDVFGNYRLYEITDSLHIGSPDGPSVKLLDHGIVCTSKLDAEKSRSGRDLHLTVGNCLAFQYPEEITSGTPIYNNHGHLCSIVTQSVRSQYVLPHSSVATTTYKVPELWMNGHREYKNTKEPWKNWRERMEFWNYDNGIQGNYRKCEDRKCVTLSSMHFDSAVVANTYHAQPLTLVSTLLLLLSATILGVNTKALSLRKNQISENAFNLLSNNTAQGEVSYETDGVMFVDESVFKKLSDNVNWFVAYDEGSQFDLTITGYRNRLSGLRAKTQQIKTFIEGLNEIAKQVQGQDNNNMTANIYELVSHCEQSEVSITREMEKLEIPLLTMIALLEEIKNTRAEIHNEMERIKQMAKASQQNENGESIYDRILVLDTLEQSDASAETEIVIHTLKNEQTIVNGELDKIRKISRRNRGRSLVQNDANEKQVYLTFTKLPDVINCKGTYQRQNNCWRNGAFEICLDKFGATSSLALNRKEGICLCRTFKAYIHGHMRISTTGCQENFSDFCTIGDKACPSTANETISVKEGSAKHVTFKMPSNASIIRNSIAALLCGVLALKRGMLTAGIALLLFVIPQVGAECNIDAIMHKATQQGEKWTAVGSWKSGDCIAYDNSTLKVQSIVREISYLQYSKLVTDYDMKISSLIGCPGGKSDAICNEKINCTSDTPVQYSECTSSSNGAYVGTDCFLSGTVYMLNQVCATPAARATLYTQKSAKTTATLVYIDEKGITQDVTVEEGEVQHGRVNIENVRFHAEEHFPSHLIDMDGMYSVVDDVVLSDLCSCNAEAKCQPIEAHCFKPQLTQVGSHVTIKSKPYNWISQLGNSRIPHLSADYHWNKDKLTLKVLLSSFNADISIPSSMVSEIQQTCLLSSIASVSFEAGESKNYKFSTIKLRSNEKSCFLQADCGPCTVYPTNKVHVNNEGLATFKVLCGISVMNECTVYSDTDKKTFNVTGANRNPNFDIDKSLAFMHATYRKTNLESVFEWLSDKTKSCSELFTNITGFGFKTIIHYIFLFIGLWLALQLALTGHYWLAGALILAAAIPIVAGEACVRWHADCKGEQIPKLLCLNGNRTIVHGLWNLEKRSLLPCDGDKALSYYHKYSSVVYFNFEREYCKHGAHQGYTVEEYVNIGNVECHKDFTYVHQCRYDHVLKCNVIQQSSTQEITHVGCVGNCYVYNASERTGAKIILVIVLALIVCTNTFWSLSLLYLIAEDIPRVIATFVGAIEAKFTGLLEHLRSDYLTVRDRTEKTLNVFFLILSCMQPAFLIYFIITQIKRIKELIMVSISHTQSTEIDNCSILAHKLAVVWPKVLDEVPPSEIEFHNGEDYKILMSHVVELVLNLPGDRINVEVQSPFSQERIFYVSKFAPGIVCAPAHAVENDNNSFVHNDTMYWTIDQTTLDEMRTILVQKTCINHRDLPADFKKGDSGKIFMSPGGFYMHSGVLRNNSPVCCLCGLDYDLHADTKELVIKKFSDFSLDTVQQIRVRQVQTKHGKLQVSGGRGTSEMTDIALIPSTSAANISNPQLNRLEKAKKKIKTTALPTYMTLIMKGKQLPMREGENLSDALQRAFETKLFDVNTFFAQTSVQAKKLGLEEISHSQSDLKAKCIWMAKVASVKKQAEWKEVTARIVSLTKQTPVGEMKLVNEGSRSVVTFKDVTVKPGVKSVVVGKSKLTYQTHSALDEEEDLSLFINQYKKLIAEDKRFTKYLGCKLINFVGPTVVLKTRCKQAIADFEKLNQKHVPFIEENIILLLIEYPEFFLEGISLCSEITFGEDLKLSEINTLSDYLTEICNLSTSNLAEEYRDYVDGIIAQNKQTPPPSESGDEPDAVSILSADDIVNDRNYVTETQLAERNQRESIDFLQKLLEQKNSNLVESNFFKVSDTKNENLVTMTLQHWLNTSGAIHVLQIDGIHNGHAFVNNGAIYTCHHVGNKGPLDITYWSNPGGQILTKNTLGAVPFKLRYAPTTIYDVAEGDVNIYRGITDVKSKIRKPTPGHIYIVFDMRRKRFSTMVCTGQMTCGSNCLAYNTFALLDITKPFADGENIIHTQSGMKGVSGSPIYGLDGNVYGVYGTSMPIATDGIERTLVLQKLSSPAETSKMTVKTEEILALFDECKAKKRWLRISAPTGVGKSTKLIVQLAYSHHNFRARGLPTRLYVMVPTQALANSLGEYVTRYVAENANFAKLMNIRIRHGDSDAQTTSARESEDLPITIEYTTWGSAAMRIDEIMNATFVIGDEIHTRKNADLQAVCAILNFHDFNNIITLTATTFPCGRFVDYKIESDSKFAVQDRVLEKFAEDIDKESAYWIPGSGDGRNVKYKLPKESVNKNYHALIFYSTKNECEKAKTELLSQGALAVVMYSGKMESAPAGAVICATDAVESGITIPDVNLVIDFKQQNQVQTTLSLDRGINYARTMKISPVDECQKLQRRGRTGRTCPGEYWSDEDVTLSSFELFPKSAIYEAAMLIVGSTSLVFNRKMTYDHYADENPAIYHFAKLHPGNAIMANLQHVDEDDQTFLYSMIQRARLSRNYKNISPLSLYLTPCLNHCLSDILIAAKDKQLQEDIQTTWPTGRRAEGEHLIDVWTAKYNCYMENEITALINRIDYSEIAGKPENERIAYLKNAMLTRSESTEKLNLNTDYSYFNYGFGMTVAAVVAGTFMYRQYKEINVGERKVSAIMCVTKPVNSELSNLTFLQNWDYNDAEYHHKQNMLNNNCCARLYKTLRKTIFSVMYKIAKMTGDKKAIDYFREINFQLNSEVDWYVLFQRWFEHAAEAVKSFDWQNIPEGGIFALFPMIGLVFNKSAEKYGEMMTTVAASAFSIFAMNQLGANISIIGAGSCLLINLVRNAVFLDQDQVDFSPNLAIAVGAVPLTYHAIKSILMGLPAPSTNVNTNVKIMTPTEVGNLSSAFFAGSGGADSGYQLALFLEHIMRNGIGKSLGEISGTVCNAVLQLWNLKNYTVSGFTTLTVTLGSMLVLEGAMNLYGETDDHSMDHIKNNRIAEDMWRESSEKREKRIELLRTLIEIAKVTIGTVLNPMTIPFAIARVVIFYIKSRMDETEITTKNLVNEVKKAVFTCPIVSVITVATSIYSILGLTSENVIPRFQINQIPGFQLNCEQTIMERFAQAVKDAWVCAKQTGEKMIAPFVRVVINCVKILGNWFNSVKNKVVDVCDAITSHLKIAILGNFAMPNLQGVFNRKRTSPGPVDYSNVFDDREAVKLIYKYGLGSLYEYYLHSTFEGKPIINWYANTLSTYPPVWIKDQNLLNEIGVESGCARLTNEFKGLNITATLRVKKIDELTLLTMISTIQENVFWTVAKNECLTTKEKLTHEILAKWNLTYFLSFSGPDAILFYKNSATTMFSIIFIGMGSKSCSGHAYVITNDYLACGMEVDEFDTRLYPCQLLRELKQNMTRYDSINLCRIKPSTMDRDWEGCCTAICMALPVSVVQQDLENVFRLLTTRNAFSRGMSRGMSVDEIVIGVLDVFKVENKSYPNCVTFAFVKEPAMQFLNKSELAEVMPEYRTYLCLRSLHDLRTCKIVSGVRLLVTRILRTMKDAGLMISLVNFITGHQVYYDNKITGEKICCDYYSSCYRCCTVISDAGIFTNSHGCKGYSIPLVRNTTQAGYASISENGLMNIVTKPDTILWESLYDITIPEIEFDENYEDLTQDITRENALEGTPLNMLPVPPSSNNYIIFVNSLNERSYISFEQLMVPYSQYPADLQACHVQYNTALSVQDFASIIRHGQDTLRARAIAVHTSTRTLHRVNYMLGMVLSEICTETYGFYIIRCDHDLGVQALKSAVLKRKLVTNFNPWFRTGEQTFELMAQPELSRFHGKKRVSIVKKYLPLVALPERINSSKLFVTAYFPPLDISLIDEDLNVSETEPMCIRSLIDSEDRIALLRNNQGKSLNSNQKRRMRDLLTAWKKTRKVEPLPAQKSEVLLQYDNRLPSEGANATAFESRIKKIAQLEIFKKLSPKPSKKNCGETDNVDVQAHSAPVDMHSAQSTPEEPKANLREQADCLLLQLEKVSMKAEELLFKKESINAITKISQENREQHRFDSSLPGCSGTSTAQRSLTAQSNPEESAILPTPEEQELKLNSKKSFLGALLDFGKSNKLVDMRLYENKTPVSQNLLQLRITKPVAEALCQLTPDTQHPNLGNESIVHFDCVSQRRLINDFDDRIGDSIFDSRPITNDIPQGLTIIPFTREQKVNNHLKTDSKQIRKMLASLDGAVTGPVWDAMKRYKRVYLPKNSALDTVSRGFYKIHSLEEDLHLIRDSSKILDLSAGEGGFAHFVATYPQKGKKEYVWTTLIRPGHSNMQVDNITSAFANANHKIKFRQCNVSNGDFRLQEVYDTIKANTANGLYQLLILDCGEASSNIFEESRWLLKEHPIYNKQPSISKKPGVALMEYIKLVKAGGHAVIKMLGFESGTVEMVQMMAPYFSKILAYKMPTSSYHSREWYFIGLNKMNKQQSWPNLDLWVSSIYHLWSVKFNEYFNWMMSNHRIFKSDAKKNGAQFLGLGFKTETRTMKDILKTLHGDEHLHTCDKCGQVYAHTHKYNYPEHKQTPNQCPNADCSWYWKLACLKNETRSRFIEMKTRTAIKQRPVVPVYSVHWRSPTGNWTRVSPAFVEQKLKEAEIQSSCYKIPCPDKWECLGETFTPDVDQRYLELKREIESKGWHVLPPTGKFEKIHEVGRVNFKVAFGNEKHTYNKIIGDMAYHVFGLSAETSVIGHTQCTEEFISAAHKKRLDIKPNEPNLADQHLLYQASLANCTPEYNRIAKGPDEAKFKPLKVTEAIQYLNMKGAGGKLDEYRNFEQAVQDPEFIKTCEQYWEKLYQGQTVLNYQTCRDKRETKAKKCINSEGELVLPEGLSYYDQQYKKCNAEDKRARRKARREFLAESSKIMPRNIRYTQLAMRLLDVCLLQPYQSYHNNVKKMYYGSVTGTPLWKQGDILKIISEVYGPDEDKAFITGDEIIDQHRKMFSDQFLSEYDRRAVKIMFYSDEHTKNVLNRINSQKKLMISSGDFSGWDGTLNNTDHTIEMLHLRGVYQKAFHPWLKARATMYMFNFTLTDTGNLLFGWGQRGSGDQATSSGNTFHNGNLHIAAVATSFGISCEEAIRPIAEVQYRRGFENNPQTKAEYKTYYVSMISHVADGDDNNHFGLAPDIENMCESGIKFIERCGKKIRSGTRAGYDNSPKFEDLSFCSHHYERTRIEVNNSLKYKERHVNQLSISKGERPKRIGDKYDPRDPIQKQAFELVNQHHPEFGRWNQVHQRVYDALNDLKVTYLPTRVLPEIIGKLTFTIKNEVMKIDFNRNYGSTAADQRAATRNERAIEISRGKSLAYMLNYIHIECVRKVVFSIMATIGDGTCDIDFLRKRGYNVPSTTATMQSAVSSVHNVELFEQIETLPRKFDRLGLTALRRNAQQVYETGYLLEGTINQSKICPTDIEALVERLNEWLIDFCERESITIDQYWQNLLLSLPAKAVRPCKAVQQQSNFAKILMSLLTICSTMGKQHWVAALPTNLDGCKAVEKCIGVDGLRTAIIRGIKYHPSVGDKTEIEIGNKVIKLLFLSKDRLLRLRRNDLAQLLELETKEQQTQIAAVGLFKNLHKLVGRPMQCKLVR